MYNLNEILKFELEDCMLHIRLYTDTSGMFANCLPVAHLEMELDRLLLLINVLLSKIEFAEYVDIYCEKLCAVQSSLELSDELFYSYYAKEKLQVLQKYRHSNFTLSKDKFDFVDVLCICSHNLNMLWERKDYEGMGKEIYINHNLPYLIFCEIDLGVLRYYIENECFYRSVSKHTGMSEEQLQAYYKKWSFLYRKHHCHKMVANYLKVRLKIIKYDFNNFHSLFKKKHE